MTLNMIWGRCPQPPGVYRLMDQSMKTEKAALLSTAFILQSPIRRSGRSPALPYPPKG
jgi:hypothetical protein